MTKFVCILTNFAYSMTKFVYLYDKLCLHMTKLPVYDNFVCSMTNHAASKKKARGNPKPKAESPNGKVCLFVCFTVFQKSAVDITLPCKDGPYATQNGKGMERRGTLCGNGCSRDVLLASIVVPGDVLLASIRANLRLPLCFLIRRRMPRDRGGRPQVAV